MQLFCKSNPVRTFFLIGLVGCMARASTTPEIHHSIIANMVATFLNYQHYAPQKIDDDLSKRWLDTYIDDLDFNRMIFLSSDIEEFKQWSFKLDNDILLREPKLSAATQIYNRYQQRVQERMAAAQQHLTQPIDLSQNMSWEPDRSEAQWPATGAEADELWRLRIMEQVLLGDLQDRPREESVEILQRRYERFEREVSGSEAVDIIEYYLGALTHSFDPHSAYFKPATSDNFDIEMSNAVEGIGAQLRTEDEYTVVVAILPGGPADIDGTLQPGDKIAAVAQGNGEPVDIIDMHIDKVVRMIRGEKGTVVRLTVLPADGDYGDIREIPLVRDQVVLTESDASSEVIEVGGHSIGVIEVPSFYVDMVALSQGDPNYRGVSKDVEKHLVELQQQSVDAVILDLRDNGGGSLTEAVRMTGLFIDRGPVVQIRDKDGRIEVLDDPERGQVYGGPLVVLTSPLSASASEIVAGAIQDYGRGIVIGAETTHGKGTVQQVVDLDRFLGEEGLAGALKLTTQKFYRASGSSTQQRGVRSDVVLPSPWDGLDVYESDLDNALAWDQINAARYSTLDDISSLLPALQQQSATRVANSEDFQRLQENLQEREERLNETSVSLNINIRRQEIENEESADSSDEESEEEGEDFILLEAASVLNDFLAQQR